MWATSKKKRKRGSRKQRDKHEQLTLLVPALAQVLQLTLPNLPCFVTHVLPSFDHPPFREVAAAMDVLICCSSIVLMHLRRLPGLADISDHRSVII